MRNEKTSWGRAVGAALTVFALFVPMQGFGASWLAKSQVDRVVVHDWGDAVFIYTSVPASSEGCSGGTNPVILLRSNPQFKEIYAAALTASIARTTVGGFINGCDSGHYSLPLLQRIDVLGNPSTPYP
jgi:hypothetical protein